MTLAALANLFESRLQNFQTSFTLDRFDLKTWGNCLKFFKQPDDFGKTPKEEICIPGMRRPLSPYQAYAAYWMLTTEKTLNGGYLADAMGLGKVHSPSAIQASSTYNMNTNPGFLTGRRPGPPLHFVLLAAGYR
jgi:hypothetical protein